MSNLPAPASAHYEGTRGEAYFQWQSGGNALASAAEVARKFAPYIRPLDRVLDLGCGGGFLLAQLECAHRVGIDPNPAARASAAALGIECYATLSGVPDRSFDVAISHHALEHMPFPAGVLAKLRTKLRPGATVALCVPIDDWRTQRTYQPGDVHHHLYTWTPQLLGNVLGEAGFRAEPRNIRILRHAIHPAFLPVRPILPRFVFRFLCFASAVALRRRELFAVVRCPSE